MNLLLLGGIEPTTSIQRFVHKVLFFFVQIRTPSTQCGPGHSPSRMRDSPPLPSRYNRTKQDDKPDPSDPTGGPDSNKAEQFCLRLLDLCTVNGTLFPV